MTRKTVIDVLMVPYIQYEGYSASRNPYRNIMAAVGMKASKNKGGTGTGAGLGDSRRLQESRPPPCDHVRRGKPGVELRKRGHNLGTRMD
jgi:hypothetical protein